MNEDRLLKLAELLEADADSPKGVKFDLALWGCRDDLSDRTRPRSIKVDCGTTACAIGFACISNVFEEEGFAGKLVTKNTGSGNNVIPQFDGREGMGAVTEFFGIDYSEAMNLFDNYAYERHERSGKAGKLAVSRRIRGLVESRAPTHAQ